MFEDAFRRDITINSLFYNIHTQQVEDFTGKGLADLQGGIIRTPLAPRETFLDDPLRILRVIRFASRFNYRIEPSIFEAAVDPQVRMALHDKVSKERIWTELDKMIQGKFPYISFRYIHDMKLYSLLFEPVALQLWNPPLISQEKLEFLRRKQENGANSILNMEDPFSLEVLKVVEKLEEYEWP